MVNKEQNLSTYLIDTCKENNGIIYQEEKAITLVQLLSRADNIMQQLVKKSIDTYVIVHMESSIECLATILAIWRLGSVYIPVNKNSPHIRLEQIKEELGHFSEIKINSNKKVAINNTNTNSQIKNEDNTAYIIFTSGTTGLPKGVKVTHENIISLLNVLKLKFNFSNHEVWLNAHSLEFDFSIWEIFAPLIYGHNLVLIDQTMPYELDKISNYIDYYKITVLNQTPSAFYNLIPYIGHIEDTSIQHIIFGGEKVNLTQLNSFQDIIEKGINFYNLYGITEITIHATFHKIVTADFEQKFISNIGKGLFDNSVGLYFSNNSNKDIGEIIVSGPTVSLGYLNNKEKTNETFRIINGQKTYFSGDQGKYLPNGEIEYLGRRDNQIEINGFRVELSEIEDAVKKIFPAMNDVISLYENNKLVVYYTGNQLISSEKISSNLKELLPSYMIPYVFYKIEKIPLTLSGKIDKHKLVQLVKISHKETIIEEKTSFYRWLQGELQQMISHQIKLDCNKSFLDLGISSIELISLHQKIIDAFDSNNAPSIVDLFQYPSIKEFDNAFKLTRRESI